MGLRFRKSVNFGPFRVNLSKSGIGYSVGGKGARITKKAKGGFRATASVPGTGVSYTTDFGGKKSNSQRNSGKKQAVVPDTPNQPNSPKKKFSLGEALIALVLVLILVAASSCSDDSDNPTAQAEQPTTTIEQTEEQPKAEQPTTTPKTEQAAPAAAEKPKEQPKAEQPATTPKAEPEQTAPAAPAESKEVAYVLNTSSKKFHSPNCADVKRISSENYGTCSSREEAVSMGYKPCGHCKP